MKFWSLRNGSAANTHVIEAVTHCEAYTSVGKRHMTHALQSKGVLLNSEQMLLSD